VTTGLEPIVAKALEPVIGKVAGTSASRATGFLFGRFRDNLHDRKARRMATESPSAVVPKVKNIPDISSDVAHALVGYVSSADYFNVCLQLAIDVLARGKTSKYQLLNSAPMKRQMDAGLKHYLTGVPNSEITEISEALFNVSLQTVFRAATQEAGAMPSQTAEAAALQARVVANIANSAIRTAELLENAASLVGYRKFEERLRYQIREAHSSMRLPHAGTTRKVPYDKLFVEPRIEGFASLATTDIRAVVNAVPRVVILGDPGGGKSTLTLKLTYDLARQLDYDQPDALPFLLVLREYAESFKSNKQTIVSYLESICRSPYNVEPPAGAIEYLLLCGRAFVVLDGLDELVDVSLRRQLVASVEAFANLYPTVPILVTSRRVGYDEAPLDVDQFQVGYVAPLEDGQVKEYAAKWFALDDSITPARRRELGTAFIADSQFVSDLRKNPLMLSLMCGIYASEHYIPANRPDVYKKCAELLFERWDKQRGIITPLPFDAHVRLAINALAYWMYSENKYQNGLSRAVLTNFMTSYLLRKRFEDEAEAENAAEQFIDFCTGRSWVLTDVGANDCEELYGFTHRTFLEYFAANQLVRLNPSASALFEQLRPRIVNAEWDVVAQLALQIVSNNVEDGADDFIRLVLADIGEVSELDARRNLLRFAARAVAFIVPRPAIIREIAKRVVDDICESISDENYDTKDSGYSNLLDCSQENLGLVSREIYVAAMNRLRLDKADLRALQIGLYPGILIGGSAVGRRSIDASFVDTRQANLPFVKSLLRDQSTVDMYIAVNAAIWGEIPMSDVLARFGPGILYSDAWCGIGQGVSFAIRFWIQDGLRPQMQPFALETCISDVKAFLLTAPAPWAQRQDVEIFSGLLFDYPYAKRSYEDIDAIVLIMLPVCELDPGEYLERTGRRTNFKSSDNISRLLLALSNARRDKLSESYRDAERELARAGVSDTVARQALTWAKGEVSYLAVRV
jgi:hypothetical protein